ncbi:3-hydroxyacyl-CoA dehydrogenase family protein [Flavobacterium restrictum]|uniref:3-hydroxyacyl-CoA dehydrogenase family protein n=1 Tax=Flavobacterium restrictum TaxID=2594428 RepID=A0A553EDM1_9FLAO|nr:3-hydroxyacyl-CoA dehydrogenase family protein [Flavobacterium restrictum]TRX43116.1 3-hydroxyacyl-CoA dehydrogenase family protein [Flavobacterium restrictum]
MEIKKITVIGAGNMGHQIALCAALSGFEVKCTDTNPDILAKAIAFANNYLNERVTKGKLTEEEANKTKQNLAFVPTIQEAVVETDLVIEAIIEKLDVKRKLFADLDAMCPAHTILATNSSYIVSSKIADATNRPDKVCNMHFFNPALVMKLVEVVQGSHVSNETVDAVMNAAKKMNKTPVLLHKEIYGFLVNRLLQATRQEALKLLDMGVASFEDIDTAAKNGLGYPMGPFQLLDLTGIDLAYHVGMEKYKESGDAADRPSPTVVEKFTKGDFGKKAGKGFYDYE